jgi:phosphoribosylformylglycinamidine cyclo-ligase
MSSADSPNPYRAAGVDYEALDQGKRMALAAALGTSKALLQHGGRAFDQSRGEPAFAFQVGSQKLAFVLEGLGTKSMIARRVCGRRRRWTVRRGCLRHGRSDRQ